MPTSLSDTIDIRYRLRPKDLGGRPRSVCVRNVSLQGVETLTPLVHFDGLAHPLALNSDQRMQLAGIARSHLLMDWIGMPLILRPEQERGVETIRLVSTNGQATRPNPKAPTDWANRWANRRRTVQVLLLALLLMAAFAAVSLVETLPTFDSLQGILGR